MPWTSPHREARAVAEASTAAVPEASTAALHSSACQLVSCNGGKEHARSE